MENARTTVLVFRCLLYERPQHDLIFEMVSTYFANLTSNFDIESKRHAVYVCDLAWASSLVGNHEITQLVYRPEFKLLQKAVESLLLLCPGIRLHHLEEPDTTLDLSDQPDGGCGDHLNQPPCDLIRAYAANHLAACSPQLALDLIGAG